MSGISPQIFTFVYETFKLTVFQFCFPITLYLVGAIVPFAKLVKYYSVTIGVLSVAPVFITK